MKTRPGRTRPDPTGCIIKRSEEKEGYSRVFLHSRYSNKNNKNRVTKLFDVTNQSIPRFLLRLYVFSQVRLPPFPTKTSPQKKNCFFFFPCHDPIFWSWISFYLCACFDLVSSMPFFSCCTKASLCYSPGRFVSNSCFLLFYSHCRNLEHGGYTSFYFSRDLISN